VFCAKLRPPPSTNWHYTSLILSAPTRSPWFQAHWLGQLPNSLGRSNSDRSKITRRDGNRHVHWELLRRRPEGSVGVYNQKPHAGRPTASDCGWHSGLILLKNRLRRQWQITRDPTLRAEVNRLQKSVTRQLEWSNDQWSATLKSLDPEDQSLWRITKRVMRVPTPSLPPGHPGKTLSQTLRKPKPLLTLETQFQPVSDPSVPAVRDGWRGAVLLSDTCQRTQVN